jgi:uncharacterized protein (DUF1684 family)
MKIKYLPILLLLISLKSFAQDYQAQIAAFRKNYMNDFLEDKNSPIKKEDLQYLQFYNADSTYRVKAKYQLLQNPQTFIMPVFSGAGREYAPYAVLKFTLKNTPMQLTVYRSLALANIPAYKDYLLLLFTDETNGKATYGGGRYIDMREGEFKNDEVTLDFNKAYNPYCAFSAGYSCPKPPDENHLAIAVQAGEKVYGKAHLH